MPERLRRPGFSYLAFDDFEESLADKAEGEKWELIGGRVVKMMVGARWEHHLIIRNIATDLSNLFEARNSTCGVFTETFWLKEPSLDLAIFPDVMVHCRPLPPDATAINDPVVAFEVVSEGSAYRDRVEKRGFYQQLHSLQHYVLVDRDRPLVEVYDRSSAGTWAGTRQIEGLGGLLSLPAIEAELALSRIYRRVFEAGAFQD